MDSDTNMNNSYFRPSKCLLEVLMIHIKNFKVKSHIIVIPFEFSPYLPKKIQQKMHPVGKEFKFKKHSVA